MKLALLEVRQGKSAIVSKSTRTDKPPWHSSRVYPL
jgi:hypothetical protein